VKSTLALVTKGKPLSALAIPPLTGSERTIVTALASSARTAVPKFVELIDSRPPIFPTRKPRPDGINGVEIPAPLAYAPHTTRGAFHGDAAR
jgi:hypothetical protein